MFRRIVSGVVLGAATCAVLGLVDGCLTRPVEATNPVTKTNFITSIPQGSIDKVDILFDIDNSASMGDKQAYLSKAIPDLLTRLVTPNCVNAAGTVTGSAMLSGACTDPNSSAEFPPVHNLHIGIVSSSLGGRLGDACDPSAQQTTAQGMISRHNDDQAHLLDRGADPMNLTNYTESPVGAADPDHFLDWFPPSSVNASNAAVTPTGPTPVTDPTALSTDFQQLVVGVHQFGCGIESQLESWYRFLIQPDPYASLGLDKTGKFAQWVGVDTTILAQRADFLRPDSLVAILVLTDENDSEVDVRAFGGTAWNFMSTKFNPPRGTSICATTPSDPTCTSCAFGKNGNDSECMNEGGFYTSTQDLHNWGYDLNLRHVHEKQKYGVSVQFPIQRYVLGLTSPRVPNRDTEYPSGAQSYQGTASGALKCVNPLYATNLPTAPSGGNWNPTADELCSLTPGTRKPGLVYYAHIGGVPHQLLQVDPSKTDDASQAQKATLTEADWQLILGKDPENFDYTGIDPHMVESYQQRTGVAVPPNGFPVADQSQPEGTDPISGREWTTDSVMAEHTGLLVDREYACIFPLENKRDCSMTATNADPTLTDSCDCQPPDKGGAFTHAQIPAVCNDATPTQQDSAKAYPTIRELELAHLLGAVPGANVGIISSLCPIHTTDMSGNGTDPLYGYRPAMDAIITALSKSLSHQCLPQRLTIDPSTSPPSVPCLVLGTFPSGNGAPTSCTDPILVGAYVTPDPTVLKEFRTDQHAAWVQGGSVGIDPSTQLTCALKQLTPNVPCDTGMNEGWCYIDQNAKGCAQEILFSKDALKAGVTTSLQCLEASILGDASVITSTTTPTPTGDAGH
ncbi:MAG TPA: hypothetical protein VK762_01975 [Polyangiaceae bacterium]|nr:hypothetical protein [Polyangiaceae bacterium]